MSRPRELPIPAAIARDKGARDVLRVWTGGDDNHTIVLRSDEWEDPAVWGMLLADLARHVAASYAEAGADPDAVLDRVREGFDAEWESPTK
ncbi:MAG: DUF5076 domain-containing protein [Deltaproteobacteria bacterium]|nr:DUF5076 domain-containing protein [Deltaproteobacteria bacterium]MDQ3296300.1 DUF5076 domain-containing protein [Myxococcota bacterium]